MTRRPLVGVTANGIVVNDLYAAQVCGDRTLEALIETTDAWPMILPGMPGAASTGELVELLDGLVLTGGRPNVHPEEYGARDDGRHGPFDRGRDRVMLPLLAAMIEAGKPVFGICRGIQEINVVEGGTLHPEVSDEPGRLHHRMPTDEKDPAVIFRPRHRVRLSEGGTLARLTGRTEVTVNSLHGQAVWQPGSGVAVEGVAEDGTIEAISVPRARRFALGVQWHAEYDAATDPVQRPLWDAFGAAAREAFAERAGRTRA